MKDIQTFFRNTKDHSSRSAFKIKEATQSGAYRDAKNAIKNGNGSVFDLASQAIFITAKLGSEFAEDLFIGPKTDFRILWGIIAQRAADLNSSGKIGRFCKENRLL